MTEPAQWQDLEGKNLDPLAGVRQTLERMRDTVQVDLDKVQGDLAEQQARLARLRQRGGSSDG